MTTRRMFMAKVSALVAGALVWVPGRKATPAEGTEVCTTDASVLFQASFSGASPWRTMDDIIFRQRVQLCRRGKDGVRFSTQTVFTGRNNYYRTCAGQEEDCPQKVIEVIQQKLNYCNTTNFRAQHASLLPELREFTETLARMQDYCNNQDKPHQLEFFAWEKQGAAIGHVYPPN